MKSWIRRNLIFLLTLITFMVLNFYHARYINFQLSLFYWKESYAIKWMDSLKNSIKFMSLSLYYSMLSCVFGRMKTVYFNMSFHFCTIRTKLQLPFYSHLRTHLFIFFLLLLSLSLSLSFSLSLFFWDNRFFEKRCINLYNLDSGIEHKFQSVLCVYI